MFVWARALRLGFVVVALSCATVVTTCAMLVVSPSHAIAQNGDAYRTHMNNGVKLYQDKNYTAALVEFRAAFAAEPKASPLVNIALCHKALFEYPKAIQALERALADYGDTMSEADRKAAKDAIVEMRGLLATIRVEVTPKGATLFIDGSEQPPGTLDQPIPLGPGLHKIGVRLPGYAPGEQSVTVASGENDKVVAFRLVPNQGYVTVTADDASIDIVIDGQTKGRGTFTGLLDPGAYVVQFVRAGQPVYAAQIRIEAGKISKVRRGEGGVPIVGSPAPTTKPVVPPPPAPPKAEPEPEKRGVFALATGSLLWPLMTPEGFPSAEPNSGAAAGIRLGYRVNTPAAFELLFEYGNVSIDSNDEASEYSLTSVRTGLNLRLMTPGDRVRLIGALGGGFVQNSLSFDEGVDPSGNQCEGCSGIDGFILAEFGLEVEWGGVLLGASLQNYFQSTKGLESDTHEPYATNPLLFVGGGLRIGYGTW